MEVFFVSVSFTAGFAACWFSKDWVTKFATGAKAFADALEAKAAAVKAAL